MRAALALAGVLLAGAVQGRASHADPYRLRASVLSQTRSPVGLVVLESEARPRSWLSAEALVWTGAGPGVDADALVIAVHARVADRKGERTGEATLGRFVVTAGALRPVHLDGAFGRVRLPWHGVSVELFGGLPVAPGLGARAYDWLAGGRVSRALGRWGSTGIAYMHRRDHGRLADEEVGLDAGGAVGERLDVSARLAYDLATPGLSDLMLTASWRRSRAVRLEAFVAHRSPARIVPATSLFSVLGDVPAQSLGVVAHWRAAPRLDVSATLSARAAGLGGPEGDTASGSDSGSGSGSKLGGELAVRSRLRLDDRGASSVGLQARRMSGTDGELDSDWLGVRASCLLALAEGWRATGELELVVPDDGRDRGSVWPWLLAALVWQPAAGWQAAFALEAGASPRYRARVDAMLTVSRAWEVGQ